MSIISILNQIRNDDVVLPAIQRDFVWSEDKTEKLLDSVMRGYPIGIVLLWETYGDIQFRQFVADFGEGNVHVYKDNPQRKRLKLVLDGQQRLQSLYVALYGTRDGKHLYFDLLSGRESDDVAEDRFLFEFLDQQTALARRESTRIAGPQTEQQPAYFHRVQDLFRLSPREKHLLTEGIASELAISADDKLRMTLNLSTLDTALALDENILKISTIDEDLPAESPSRKSEADVLEIFVRVNREGTPLSRSDLIFSMLKLNWKESAEALPEFVRTINVGNSFGLDTDFVIRSLFAVSDIGTKLDLNLLRKRSNVEKLRSNFEGCCDAIRAAVDFVSQECKCSSSSLLGSANTLVPLVYYLFYTRNHELPNSQLDRAKQAIYLLGFARPFSRWADSRLGAFIREELRPLREAHDETFPFESTLWWVKYWERVQSFSDLIELNHDLTLHLVQGLTGAKFQYERNSPQIDHIFPRSTLRTKEFDEEEVNNVANFWILARGKNQNKTNRKPADYFRDVSPDLMKRAAIDPELLDYRRYRTFLKTRKEALVKQVRRMIPLCAEELR